MYLCVVNITIIVFNKAKGHCSFSCFCIMYNENNEYANTLSSTGPSNANVLTTLEEFTGVILNMDMVKSPIMCILKNKKPNIKLCLVKKLLLFVGIICNYIKKIKNYKKFIEMVGVSETGKFIFIHIPKTGGMTIKNSIPFYKQLYCKRQNIVANPTRNCIIDNEYVNVLYHLTYKELISLYPKYSSDEYFKFTFVRNPYDKLYSTYLYAKKINNDNAIYLILPFILFILVCIFLRKYPAIVLTSFIILLTLVLYYIKYYKLYFCCKGSFNNFVRNQHVFNGVFNYVIQSQYHYIKDANMNFIGREETFEHDFKTLCELIDIDVDIVSTNVINKPSADFYKYIKYYDNYTLNYVNTRYKEDFEHFNYHMIKYL